MTYNMKKSEKNRIKSLTFSNFCAILFLVSERNTMKNQMTMTEIRRHMTAKRKWNDMEKHTLENWGKIPEGWTAAKELENNLKDIQKNLKNSA